MDSLGVGFSYEEIFEMCQKVTKGKMDTRQQNKLNMTNFSGDRGHIVDVDTLRQDGGFLDTGVDLGKARNRLRRSFKKHLFILEP